MYVADTSQHLYQVHVHLTERIPAGHEKTKNSNYCKFERLLSTLGNYLNNS